MVPYSPYRAFMRAWNAASGAGVMVFNAVDDWYMNGEKGRIMFRRAVDDLIAMDIFILADCFLAVAAVGDTSDEHQRPKKHE